MRPVVPLPASGRGRRRLKRLLSKAVLPAVGLAAAVGRPNRAGRAAASIWPFAEAPKSILLVRFDLLGDTVMALHLARDLKRSFAAAAIVFLTTPDSADVTRMCPYVDETLAAGLPNLTHFRSGVRPQTWAAAWQCIRSVRARRFDLAIALYGPLAGAVVGLSGAKWRTGYGAEAPPWCLDFALPGRRGPGTKHEVAWLRALGTDGADGPGGALVVPSPEALSWAQATLGAGNNRPLIALHAGARTGEAKLWPAERWRELAAGLQRELNARLVAVGDGGEREKADWILGGEGPDRQNLAGRTSIAQLAAVLQKADLVVSSDSGPLHLAAALDSPAIGLYGPTDPLLSGPYSDRSAALTVGLPCSPCYDLQAPAICPFGDALCMQWITPEQVLAQAMKLLDRRGRE